MVLPFLSARPGVSSLGLLNLYSFIFLNLQFFHRIEERIARRKMTGWYKKKWSG
jgi:hypothetical protein